MADIKEPKGIRCLEDGIIKVWYDNAGHYCDVIWPGNNTYPQETECDAVLAKVDSEYNICGFTILDIELISEGHHGHTAINLKSRLDPKENSIHRIGRTNGQDINGFTGKGRRNGNPFENGIINVRYDSASHYCDFFWAGGNTHYVQTESEHALALTDEKGVLCGFRIINTDRLGDGEHSYVELDLKTRTEIKAP